MYRIEIITYFTELYLTFKMAVLYSACHRIEAGVNIFLE